MARVRARTWAMIILVAWVIPVTGSIWSMAIFARGESTLPLLFNKNLANSSTQYQVNLGYRIPGTTARNDCANYFKSALAAYTTLVDHNYILHGIACQNVIGVLNPTVNESIVIMGAHYDSRAISDKDPAYPTIPCQGANDGASGSAVLLELARILYQIRAKLKVQIWFVFFDAEDQGNGGLTGFTYAEGSQVLAYSLETFLGPLPLSTVKLMILLDMVGGTGLRFAKDGVSDSAVQDVMFQLGRNLGYTNAFPTNPYTFSSGLIDDHKWFVQRGIPAVDFIINFNDKSTAGWPYHHTTGDSMAHISADSLEITGKTVEQFFHEYYVSAADGGGGLIPFWDWSSTEGVAVLVSSIFGICMVLGITLAFKVYVLKKREVLKV
jgi:glutaminyl-peptide cyclotransferase